MLTKFGFIILRFVERIICAGTVYPDAPFYETNRFPWVEHLENHSPEIRTEAVYMLGKFNSLMSLSKLSPSRFRTASSSTRRAWRSGSSEPRPSPSPRACRRSSVARLSSWRVRASSSVSRPAPTANARPSHRASSRTSRSPTTRFPTGWPRAPEQ